MLKRCETDQFCYDKSTQMCVFNVRKLYNLSQNSLTMNWPNFECNSDVPELWKVSVEREFPDLITLKLFMLGSTALSSSQSSKLQQIKKLPKHDIGTCCKISIPTSLNFKWVISSQDWVFIIKISLIWQDLSQIFFRALFLLIQCEFYAYVPCEFSSSSVHLCFFPSHSSSCE